MSEARNAVGMAGLLAVLRRALLIQASWSFDRMQAYGFAYAMEPALRRLYPDHAECEARLRLHTEYFNTQPYLASFILGAAVRLEEERAAGRSPASDVSGLKASLMAPLGALGDSFFWGALKPMAAAAAVAMLMTGFWWAPFLFLALFNLWHAGLRTGMLFWGYATAGDAVALMGRYPFTRMAKRFKVITLSLLGGLVGLLPLWRSEFKPAFPVSGFALMFAGMAATLVLIALLRRGGSPVKFMLGLAALCLVLAYLGVV